MGDLPPLQPEQIAQYESGPSRTASDWIEAVASRDFTRAWSLMHEDLRLSAAHDWLYRNRRHVIGESPQELASQFATERGRPDHHLWGPFLDSQRTNFAAVVDELGDEFGAGSNPRPIVLTSN